MSRSAWPLGLALLAACRPSFVEDAALVTAPRVLAVRSDPAEVKAGTQTIFTAFVAVPPTFEPVAAPVWQFCTATRPPTENNAVASACLEQASLVPAGMGFTIKAPLASNACALFGPNAVATGSRSRDSDGTGGYFQPLRVDLQGAPPTFHLQRILCGLADASADIATRFGLTYVPNNNPTLLPLVVSLAGERLALESLPRGGALELEVGWPADAAERYAYFDRPTDAIATRREAMRIAWHVSDGTLTDEATGRAEDDLTLTSRNTWTAPDTAGTSKLWVVLRDSRGGTDFAEYDLTVSR